MISQERAQTLARKYRSKAPFITRLAEFADATEQGRNPFDVLHAMGIVNDHAIRRYRLWAERLKDELAEARADYDTPNDEGDND